MFEVVRGKIWFIVLLVLMVSGLVLTQTPPSTDCTANPGSEACQAPYFTDDKATYLFDLDASWPLESGAPTDIGPSVFIGGETKGLLPDGSVNTEEDTFTSSDTVEETYVDSPGEAGTSDWALGTVESTSISIPGSTVDLNEHGNFLITSPYGGECGDGIALPGETTTNCPQDRGTPTPIILDSQPKPTEDEICFDETEDPTEPSDDPLYVTFGDNEYPDDIHFQGTDCGVTEAYNTDGSNIYSDQMTGPTDGVIRNSLVHYHTQLYLGNARHYEASSETYNKVYTEGSDKVSLCKDINTADNFYWKAPDLISDETTYSDVGSKKIYEDGTFKSGSTDVRVKRNKDTEGGEKWTECTRDKDYYKTCEKATESECNDIAVKPSYYPVEERNAELKQVVESTFTITYDDYSLTRTNEWGPVNDKPEMFDSVSGFSSDDVVSTTFGYHSDSSSLSDGRKGSNDPSVSANQYTILEPGDTDYSGSGFFEAHRDKFNFADADGPDGGGDGLIAYDEGKGVQGVEGNIFESEYWNGNPDDYISESDLGSISCPGDTVKCLVSVDVSTGQSGWGASKDASFTLDIPS